MSYITQAGVEEIHTPVDPWKEPVTILIKVNDVPALMTGVLTNDSIAALHALAQKEALKLIGDNQDIPVGISREVANYRGTRNDFRDELKNVVKDHYKGENHG